MSDFEGHGASADALRTALTAVYANAAANQVSGEDGRQFVIVPEGFNLADITDPHRLPEHIVQKVTLDAPGSLAAYANRFKGDDSVLIADIDTGRIAARLDYHSASASSAGFLGEPAHDAHAATLQLRETEEFRDWSEFCSDFWGQAEFANFLDENRVDVADPDGGTLLEIVKDLQTVQDSKVAGRVDLTNGDVTFKFESDTREVQPVKLPKTVILRLSIYAGEEPVDIECALRWRAGGGGVKLALVMKRIGRVKRELFAKIAGDVAEATSLPLYFGRL